MPDDKKVTNSTTRNAAKNNRTYKSAVIFHPISTDYSEA
mgnify:CR=1 FL=1